MRQRQPEMAPDQAASAAPALQSPPSSHFEVRIMGLPQRQVAMTAEAFIARENPQPEKHEFVAGVFFEDV